MHDSLNSRIQIKRTKRVPKAKGGSRSSLPWSIAKRSAPPQVAGCPISDAAPSHQMWDTTNPMARKRRPPHRRWSPQPNPMLPQRLPQRPPHLLPPEGRSFRRLRHLPATKRFRSIHPNQLILKSDLPRFSQKTIYLYANAIWRISAHEFDPHLRPIKKPPAGWPRAFG